MSTVSIMPYWTSVHAKDDVSLLLRDVPRRPAVVAAVGTDAVEHEVVAVALDVHCPVAERIRRHVIDVLGYEILQLLRE